MSPEARAEKGVHVDYQPRGSCTWQDVYTSGRIRKVQAVRFPYRKSGTPLMTRSTMGASVQIHEITVTLRMTPSSSDSTQRS